MDLTKISLSDFLGDNNDNVSAAPMLPRDLLVVPGTGLQRVILKTHGNYYIVLINDSGDVAAVDQKGNEAGYYSSSSLIVHEEHRKSGLGIALALHAHVYRNQLPKSRSLTTGGRKTLNAAWHVANGNRCSPWWP
jgi:hypothetical protein